MSPAAASVLVAALERSWAAIVERHPDVPPAVVVVAAGSAGRAAKLGHFAAGRWDVAGEARPEVLVAGEGLGRGPIKVLETLVHEGAHGVAHARAVVDTSRGGRYHNRRYRDVAAELGLSVEHHPSYGWSVTTLTPAAAAEYRHVLQDLERALVLWRRAEAHGSGGASGRNLDAYECDCTPKRRIRAAGGTMAKGPIICLVCKTPFGAVN